ncbi:MAG TPA: formate dehydrogenase accessory protein FdhE [Longimicrobiales bacterium]|nr:formate dehydrogenase accessory protein FdhE [Longimicrobiales bacterium]
MSTTTTADRAAERRKRMEAARRRRPEASTWLDLVDRALEAAEQSVWAELEPRLPSLRDPAAPLLHDAFVTVEPRPARRWVRGLLKTASRAPEEGAASLAGLRGRTVDPLELLTAGAGEDVEYLQDLAERNSADPAAVATVARLAALPLLRGCAHALTQQVPAGWNRGYCPVCGGWPGLAELRGLERRRVLRCGRCATGWELPVLVCPFCDERDHERHVTLAEDGGEQQRRVDACRSCSGYVKTLTTLSPVQPWALPLEDLETLELDLVAGDREFRRPEAPAREVAVRVVAAEGPLTRFTGGWA